MTVATPDAPDIAIDVHGLSKSFGGREVVHDLSMQVKRGTIQQIYFREGEMVPAQRPVLSIMPPGNMKLRFFVAEPDLPKLAIGDEIRVACDNCAADLTAKIYFIATSAEYTPPVIYSLDERNKLVYLIQARPSRPDSLRVGQPISVFPGARTPVADKR